MYKFVLCSLLGLATAISFLDVERFLQSVNVTTMAFASTCTYNATSKVDSCMRTAGYCCANSSINGTVKANVCAPIEFSGLQSHPTNNTNVSFTCIDATAQPTW